MSPALHHPAYRLLFEQLKANRRQAIFAGATTLASATSLLAPPAFLSYFVSRLPQLTGLTLGGFLFVLADFGLAVAAALMVSEFINMLGKSRWYFAVSTHLRRTTLRRIHELPLDLFQEPSRRQQVSELADALRDAETFIGRVVPEQLAALVLLLGSVILLLRESFLSLSIVLSTGIVGIFATRLASKRAQIEAELQSLEKDIHQSILENVSGSRTIRSHGGGAYFQRKFEVEANAVWSKSRPLIRRLGTLLGTHHLVRQVSWVLVLSVSAFAFVKGHLRIIEAVACPFFLALIYQGVESLTNYWPRWRRFREASQQLSDIIDHPGGGLRSVKESNFDEALREGHTLAIRELSLTTGRRTLAGPVDFQISRGELWAIMGPSGCGKSTFLEVLAGLRPNAVGYGLIQNADGQILWESAQNRPLQLPVGHAAYVERHPSLFLGTLRENLVFGNPDRLTDTSIWECLERTQLHRFVRSRGGLDQVIAVNGDTLSRAQRWLIALTRALLLKRPFLLIDESFTHMDPATVENVIAILDSERQRSAVVLVTHYLPDSLSPDGIMTFESLVSPATTESRLNA